jgi:D-alanine-D-alanine ligase-like ATP-grasp enzyme
VELHEDLRRLALDAAAALGAVLSGVDLIVGDLDGAPASGSVHINEVNTTPSLYVASAMQEGRPSSRAAAAVLRRLFDLED